MKGAVLRAGRRNNDTSALHVRRPLRNVSTICRLRRSSPSIFYTVNRRSNCLEGRHAQPANPSALHNRDMTNWDFSGMVATSTVLLLFSLGTRPPTIEGRVLGSGGIGGGLLRPQEMPVGACFQGSNEIKRYWTKRH